MNIRVDLNYPIRDGAEVVFRSPVDCSQVTGLKVKYSGDAGNTLSKEFVFADAHGNNVGDIDNLFGKNAVVKVILDVTKGMAFVQNADTNAYLESRLMRDISTGKLTATEKATFAKLDGADFIGSEYFVASNNLPGFAAWAYNHAGISTSTYLKSVHQTFIQMFSSKKDASGHLYSMKEETKENKNYFAMLLPNSYGGGRHMSAHGYFYTLTADDYQIGDIFCMRYEDTLDGKYADSCYYMALCIAENSFLLYQDFGTWEDATHASNARAIDYTGLADIISNTTSIYHYVLRPDNVAIVDVIGAEKRLNAKLESAGKVLPSDCYGTALPAAGTKGRIFFKVVG